MNKATTLALAALAATATLALGYWLGTANPAARTTAGAPQAAAAPAKERKPLFYRNPMGLPDTSPVPKKDQMGMDYIPVYEGDEPPGNEVVVSSEKIQKLGVRTAPATLRELSHTVRAVGRIEADERLTYAIAPKFEGWIERLYVNTTGQSVRRGQTLLAVYSPELVSAQQEYAIANEGEQAMRQASPEARQGMRQLADASLARMQNWDISPEPGAGARRTLAYRSPVDGIVIEKKAVQGMRFQPGDTLYQIADLSRVWILADVFEQDIGRISIGQHATAVLNAYPGKTFDAKVAYVYPTVNTQTRTAQVRLELANPGGRLKPGMYADVTLAAPSHGKVLAVPASAVINSGTRQAVLVQLAEGRFEPRPVTLGAQDADYVEIREGLGEGEQVVVSANFLIDSESNLKAAFAGMSGPTAAPATPTAEH